MHVPCNRSTRLTCSGCGFMVKMDWVWFYVDSREIEMIICSCRSIGCTTKEIQTLMKPLKSIRLEIVIKLLVFSLFIIFDTQF